MISLTIFLILSLPVILLSWKTLLAPRSHGFFRFFSWECIVWLIAFNYKFWFVEPFSFLQIISWLFLIISAYLVVAGVTKLKKAKRQISSREDKNLYEFERTSELIVTGIFSYIRHPMYASLFFLTWGILLKNPTFQLIVVAVLSTVFLYFTALFDEKECLSYFGESYSNYMKQTKRFIPIVI